MFDILKILITFILTGFVGVFISHKFQQKNNQNQLRIKKAEKKAAELKAIRDNFEKLSSERIYRTRQIISSINEKSLTDKEREGYQDSVIDWNKNLNAMFFDLSSHKLYEFAIRIEIDVHNELATAHLEIKKEIKNNKSVIPADLVMALKSTNRAYESARKVTKSLTDIADNRWDEIKDYDSEPLTYSNIHQASTITLLIALFHKSPLRLRINRSRLNR
ncbi:hypothetical protein [Pantoea sp.]|uniref:hypothetical protein n=1 Tax=Pantoea sp. TaxID=69393 RepID=UPI0031E32085